MKIFVRKLFCSVLQVWKSGEKHRVVGAKHLVVDATRLMVGVKHFMVNARLLRGKMYTRKSQCEFFI